MPFIQIGTFIFAVDDISLLRKKLHGVELYLKSENIDGDNVQPYKFTGEEGKALWNWVCSSTNVLIPLSTPEG